MILLDTCAYLWFFSNPAELKTSASKALAKEREWLVSAASVWEIALKNASGKLSLKMDVEEWVEASLCHEKLRLAPLPPKILIQSAQLPGSFHKDPFDRVITATAMHHGIALITRDQRILDYGHIQTIAC